MSRPTTAFVLAAGLGKRMRPLTDTMPKPMVPLGGRPLLDHVLDRLAAAGVTRAVVNVHYLADQIERHVTARTSPRVTISDERDRVLDTGGGVKRALPLLGTAPFIVHNSDSVWLEGPRANIDALIDAWDGERMNSLLLLARTSRCLGYDGTGDFHLRADGRVERRRTDATAPLVFTGVSIAHPRLLDGIDDEVFSLNRSWDRAIAEGRLYGMLLDGYWMHVGTPDALAAAERCLVEGEPGDVTP